VIIANAVTAKILMGQLNRKMVLENNLAINQ
jgi:hypothetical protein